LMCTFVSFTTLYSPYIHTLSLHDALPIYRRQILFKNIKPFGHPYFTKYKDLQKICKKILNYEGIKFGISKDKIYGILFDGAWLRSEEHTSELQSRFDLVCRLLLEKKKKSK